MTDTRIPCPSFPRVLETLVGLAQLYPEHTAQHAYLDNKGKPHDLVGHVLWAMDAPITEAAAGAYPWNGRTRLRNQDRLPVLWNRLFLGRPYDDRFTHFFPWTPESAEAYLVYALLDHVQKANDHPGLTWLQATRKGLGSFYRFLNSPSSGFIIQVARGDGKGGQLPADDVYHGLRAQADALVTNVLQREL